MYHPRDRIDETLTLCSASTGACRTYKVRDNSTSTATQSAASFTSPFVLKFKLGKNTHMFKQSVYTLAEWAIDIGGISRALFFGGMVFAHFVALRMYRAALIGDIFMVQDRSVADLDDDEKKPANKPMKAK